MKEFSVCFTLLGCQLMYLVIKLVNCLVTWAKEKMSPVIDPWQENNEKLCFLKLSLALIFLLWISFVQFWKYVIQRHLLLKRCNYIIWPLGGVSRPYVVDDEGSAAARMNRTSMCYVVPWQQCMTEKISLCVGTLVYCFRQFTPQLTRLHNWN